MARTRASVGAKISAGKSNKARCSAAPPPSTPSTSGTSDKSSRGNSGGNPVCPRETPKWQKPITNFFVSTPSNGADVSDNENEEAERARLLAVSEKESGFWLQALPSYNLGMFFDNISFSICVCLRLGMKTNEPHRCLCGENVSQFGHHGLSCRRSADRLSRHACVNDIIRRALVTINVPACLEPNGIARDDGKRPDGMTLVPWKQGRSLVWDATCVDTLAPSHISVTSTHAGGVAEAA
ncbi:uncharacterized protein [Epargyreus clarus]|uniref:uncharacterized protein isoform X1 n=1 Tax=Epargyreus clarus TaxID=520877 RepID=UPI003C2C92D3